MTDNLRSKIAIGLAILALVVGGAAYYQQSGPAGVISQGTRWFGSGGFALPAAGKVVIDGATTAQTNTDGSLDINGASVTANYSPLNVSSTQNNGAATGTDQYTAIFTMTGNDADGDNKGLYITASNTGVEAAGSYEYGLYYNCAVTVAGGCTDGVLFGSGGVASGLTDAVDASASNIDNALNAGSNYIVGGNGDKVTIGATDDTMIYTREDEGSVTYTCADDNANAECVFAGGGTGKTSIGTTSNASAQIYTDGTGDAELTVPNDSIGSDEITDGEVANTHIASDAAIAYSKLAAMTSANILVGNGSNVPTVVDPAGDVEIANDGSTTIQADSVEESMIAQGTASQVLMSNATPDTAWQSISGDVSLASDGAATVTQINGASLGTTTVTNTHILVADGSNWESVDTSGDVDIANDGTTSISAGAILNADVNASAAIDYSKMEDFLTLTAGTVQVATYGGTITCQASFQPITSTAVITNAVIADGATAGEIVIISNENAADDITILESGSNLQAGGNITLTGGAKDIVMLLWDGAEWIRVAFFDN